MPRFWLLGRPESGWGPRMRMRICACALPTAVLRTHFRMSAANLGFRARLPPEASQVRGHALFRMCAAPSHF
eukprot:scaffold4467_cov113-Isochrysis_galbana.AAC.2